MGWYIGVGMTLRHDRQISTKLLAASKLLRRVEDGGVDGALPRPAEHLDRAGDAPGIITVYIDIEDGEPIEHTVTNAPADVADTPSNAYAFTLSVTVEDGELTDSRVGSRIVHSIKELTDVYALQGQL